MAQQLLFDPGEPPKGTARVASGPRAVEALLFDALEALLTTGENGLEALSRPVRVVVPSRSLREHVCTTFMRRVGRPLVGLQVQTAQRVTLEILERAGQTPLLAGANLLAVHISRLARQEESLRDCLEGLSGGYSVVSGVVNDLLDAGLEPVHAEAMQESLEEWGGASAARAGAALRVAARLAEQVEQGERFHRAGLFRSAREVLLRDPEGALPNRGILIHGFADATGALTDLLEVLVQHLGAQILLDRPEDPAEPGREDAGVAFSRRFSDRFGPEAATSVRALEACSPSLLRAPTPSAEARAVAVRLRALLDAGVEPERIAVVARDLAPYALPLRCHFSRLGVPYSGYGSGPVLPHARPLRALWAVLDRPGAAFAEGWLGLLEVDESPRSSGVASRDSEVLEAGNAPSVQRADLRWALHELGIVRIDELAQLAPGTEGEVPADLELAARRGLRGADAPGGPQAVRRKVAGARLAALFLSAQRLLALCADWPSSASLGRHLQCLTELVESVLGWRLDAGSGRHVAQLVGDCRGIESEELTREEWLGLMERMSADFGRDSLGGRGGGVALLSVMEARARTFDHLFVLGLGRGAFPRTVSEDPLMPDGLRVSLRSLLPDLPVKSEGHAEERYLFAQLLQASPNVVLSAPVGDDDGRALALSPLLERLETAGRLREVVDVPSLWSPTWQSDPQAARSPRPAPEHAQVAALQLGTRRHNEALEVALAHSLPTFANFDSASLTSGRLAVAAELDYGPRGNSTQLGPYFGFTGPVREAADPRVSDLFVTTVENVFTCPWKAFLRSVLKLAAPPDALLNLPDVDSARLGSIVHEVLEWVGGRSGRPDRLKLEDALRREPAALERPDADTLAELCRTVAERVLLEEGVRWPGFAEALTRRVYPYVERALELDWPGEPDGVLGVEVGGSVTVEREGNPPRRIGFRADRLDAVGEQPVLSDYKTGRAVITASTEKIRQRNLQSAVERGELLQAVAYAIGTAERAEGGALGRYVYLSPDVDHAKAILEVDSQDSTLNGLFRETLGVMLDVWEHGSFVPRLFDAPSSREPRTCGYCEVKSACLRGDSGARVRMEAYLERFEGEAGEEPLAVSDAERALTAIWNRGRRPK
ncbi:PD-(D/E)XK nuclease family protein [Myxococcota bacterium]|nr:PD-(D/E)XK nuclease family protein [Myxococcota bacterium]